MTQKTTEASDLGWPPGHWPPTVRYEGVDYEKVFSPQAVVLNSVLYRSLDDHNDTLLVFND